MQIKFTSTGHYCIDLTSKAINADETLICDEIEFCKNEGEKRKVAVKLHRQFGHPDSSKLKSILKDAKIEDQVLNYEIESLDTSCESCQKYKRSRPTPVVGLPLAGKFNETVAMDLKEYAPGIWFEKLLRNFLHLIDHFTQYSSSCVIRTKRKEEIVKRIF